MGDYLTGEKILETFMKIKNTRLSGDHFIFQTLANINNFVFLIFIRACKFSYSFFSFNYLHTLRSNNHNIKFLANISINKIILSRPCFFFSVHFHVYIYIYIYIVLHGTVSDPEFHAISNCQTDMVKDYYVI